MLDKLLTWKAFAALALLVSPASFGLATFAGLTDAPTAPSAAPHAAPPAPVPAAAAAPDAAPENAPEAFNGVLVEEWRKSLDAAPATGKLDLRIDWGEVRVIGWNQSAYHVMLLREEGNEAQLSDYEIIRDFQDTSSSERLDLRLTVDQDGTYGVGVSANVQGNAVDTGDPTPELAIVAFVPASTTYESVHACSGQGHALGDTFSSIDWPFDEDEVVVDAECMPQDDTPGISMNMGTINLDTDGNDAHAHLNVSHGVEGLHGKDLTVFNDYGSVHAVDVAFTTTTLLTRYGHVTAERMETTDLVALTEYGHVQAQGGADTVKAWSEYGHLALNLAPSATGTYDLYTGYGDVALQLPRAAGTGYDVTAGSDYGRLHISLNETPVERQNASDDRDWTDPNTLVDALTGWMEDDDTYAHMATGQTKGFDGLPVQLTVTALTEYGDVFVVHDDASEIVLDDDREHEDHESPEEPEEPEEPGHARER